MYNGISKTVYIDKTAPKIITRNLIAFTDANHNSVVRRQLSHAGDSLQNMTI
jgi:hypothetical protein